MPNYYDWEKTLAYDADVTMVVGARGIGKTFGLRKQCVNDYLKRGTRFVEIVRYKNELADVSDGYFNRLERLDEFRDYTFRTDAKYMWIGKRRGKGKKPDWELLGYFVALSEEQKKKKKTFDLVKRLIFDESILDKQDRYHRYLPNEFGKLANVVDTVSRERADDDSMRPRLYLLGNALDLANPYFIAYRVPTNIEFGYRWFANKTFLLHYVPAGEYSGEKMTGTVAGRMLANTSAGRIASGNEFVGVNSEFVCRKPAHARFMAGLILNGKTYGVWGDDKAGNYHITKKIPNNETNVYYLSSDDATVNYLGAKRSTPLIRVLTEGYYYSMLRYEDEQTKAEFLALLALFGVS